MIMNKCYIDEKKIDTLVSSYQDAEQVVSEGSDEHLDIILDLQSALKKLSKLTADVNNDLEEKFNSIDQTSARKIVIKLTILLTAARQLSSYLKRALSSSTYDGIKTSIQELYVETKQTDEFVKDIIKYKIEDTTELKELLNGIK